MPASSNSPAPEPQRAHDLAQRVAETVLATCWAQWRSLGAFAEGSTLYQPHSVIDPEALVLLSLLLRERERRLDDLLGWWASVGATLLSVQRTHNLARHFPLLVQQRLGAFARLASEAGDRRWQRHQTKDDFTLSPRAGKGAAQPDLSEAPALLLRLRAGLGVGAKADLLALLLGLRGERITTKAAAEATGYTDVAIRTAAQEMGRARFIETTSERPARYMADPEAWAALLGFSEEKAWPRWHYWAETYAFLADVLRWEAEGRAAEWSAYVWSSRARDLMERHGRTFDLLRLPRPDAERHRGAAYLGAFIDAVQQLMSWITTPP